MKRIIIAALLAMFLVSCGSTEVEYRSLDMVYLYAEVKGMGMVCVSGADAQYYFDGEAVNIENDKDLDVVVHSTSYVVSTQVVPNLDEQCKVRIK